MKSYRLLGDEMDGVINIFKPKGVTSHDIVKRARKILGIKKVGHAGTLDPYATGVLPVCVGKGTRISEYLLDLDKEYVGELTLGIATDTQDMEGEVISASSRRVTKSEIFAVFDRFKGEIYQTPPMYSAIKYKGRKLYELAREGKTVERPARKAKIYDLKIYDIIDDEKVIFYVKCSKGTYIRTLCHDIGELLGTYGHMSYLIRTGVGKFSISDSYSLDYIEKLDKSDLKKVIIPLDDSLTHLDYIEIDKRFYNNLINGNIIPIKLDEKHYKFEKPLRVYCKGKFLGIGRITKRNDIINIKMDKVLA